MALPIINTPTYELIVPSTKQKIKFRPFLVKEEKALLIAQQSEDESVMFNTLKEVIKSCTLGNVNVDELAMFDIEYIFSQLRARSVGETVELVMKCTSCDDEKNNKTVVVIDLTQLEVTTPKDHKTDIKVADKVGIKMKYPSLTTLIKMEKAGESPEAMFDVIVDSIDYIYDENEVYHAKEQSRAELEQFIENLTQSQFEEIQGFFASMPSFSKELNYKCPSCGYENHQVITGLNNFF